MNQLNIKKMLFPKKDQLNDFNLLKEYCLIHGILSVSLNLSFFVDPIHEPIDIDGSSLTIHDKKYIEVSYNLAEKKPFLVILTVAHELGHFFSQLCQTKEESQIIERAYRKELNGRRLTTEENSVIYKEEKTAWDNARLIMKELDLYEKYKELFEIDRENTLKTYKTLPKYMD